MLNFLGAVVVVGSLAIRMAYRTLKVRIRQLSMPVFRIPRFHFAPSLVDRLMRYGHPP